MRIHRLHSDRHDPRPTAARPARAAVTGLLVVACAATSFLLGFRLGASDGGTSIPQGDSNGAPHPAPPTKYACAMMCIPPVDHGGKCPVCGMDMVPVEDGASAGSAQTQGVTLSPRARQLAEVRLARVERRPVQPEIRLFGKLDFDETRTRALSARVAGRLDTLYVNYTGVPVRKGDHLISFYSPELLTAQEELLQAARGVKEADAIGIPALRDNALQTLASTRTKLLLWGLTTEQLEEIEQRTTPDQHVTVFAPIGGVVLEKHAVEGAYVEMGERLFTIADVSVLWARIEAFESDLPWLRYGQDVELHVDAYPGDVFIGRVAFIDPLVRQATRTVGLRVNVPNSTGLLKAGMFVHAVIRPNIDADGRVLAPHLTGKWISPMHPEIVKDAPGNCDVCGMPLVSAESLGYVTGGGPSADPLVVPATAPLLTGKRAVVYVADPSQEATYAIREITLGPRAGDDYLVRAGLREGESVVAQGTLRVDSAAQILGRPSMMTSSSSPPPPTSDSAPTLNLDALLDAYTAVHDALAHDRLADAITAAAALSSAIPRDDANRASADLAALGRRLADTRDIKAVRTSFHALSNHLIALVKQPSTSFSRELRLYHCPMAFDNTGADWLQHKTGVENPYFGSEMFTCGLLKETIPPQRK